MAQTTQLDGAGVYTINLYEAKNIEFVFDASNIVTAFTSIPPSIAVLESCEFPAYRRVYQNSGNYLSSYQDQISFNTYKFNQTTDILIQALKNSYYGWIAEIIFYNGLNIIFKDPFFWIEDAIYEFNSNVVVGVMQNRVNSDNDYYLANLESYTSALVADDDSLIIDDSLSYILED